MLSLMQLLHHFFQRPSIAKEVSKALIEAIEHVNMDQVFQDNYRTFAFARLDLIEPLYQRQVHNLPELWHKLNDVIDREEFLNSFASECTELDLP